jgi:general secretion pathway protein D
LRILNRLAALAAVAVLFLPPLDAGSKKADKLLAEGLLAESKGEFDKALEFYEQALATDPTNSGYRLPVIRVRFEAGAMFVDRGQKLRKEGKLEESLAQFQRAFAIDPSSMIAEQELRRTLQMIERERRKPSATSEERGLTPVQQSKKDIEHRVSTFTDVPDLKPVSRQLTSIKMSNQNPKVLFETIGKLAGINVLFDQEFVDQSQARRYSVDLGNTTLEEALDYVGLIAKAFWKPLSPNAIFVTADNVTKRRDYEEHVTRVFYLQNMTSPQELTEVMTAMRTVTEVRKVMPYNGQNAIIVRGTADQIALAEKIINDLDKPKPEVLVDVIIIETARGRVRDIAATIVSAAGAPGLNQTISYVGSATTTPAAAATNTVRLSDFSKLTWSDFATTIPNVLLQAVMSDNQSRILNQPQARVMDGQKASLKLGQKYPYATGSFQPGVGTIGVSPLVSTQFQLLDIGVNVDITPRIHGTDEVSMQVEAEVSAIAGTVDLGGLKQPIIASRKVSHIVRVKEGEITLIGGLMSSQESRTRSGIPWLMDIPFFGHFFSTENIDKKANDIIVALIPHIVRTQEINPDNLKSVASGTESIWRMSYARPLIPVSVTAKPVSELQTPAQATPAQVAQALQPAPAAPLTPEPGAPPPPAPVRVVMKPGAVDVPVGAAVTVDVLIENVQNLFSSPMRLRFDSNVLKLVEINRGPFMGNDGQQVTFNEVKVENPGGSGGAIINLNRVAGAGGVSGSGNLVTLKFQAVGKGAASISFEELVLRDNKLQLINVAAPSATINVK